jgi:hypothetical protein
LADFNLYIPANALTFMIILAMAWSSAHLRTASVQSLSEHRTGYEHSERSTLCESPDCVAGVTNPIATRRARVAKDFSSKSAHRRTAL